jgi:hypothetical protein
MRLVLDGIIVISLDTSILATDRPTEWVGKCCETDGKRSGQRVQRNR